MEKTPLKCGKYNEDAKSSNKLTREQLMELEERDKSPRQKLFDKIITSLPILMAIVALVEYLILPDLNPNPMPHMYTCLMAGVLALYTCSVIVGIVKEKMGDKKLIRKLRKIGIIAYRKRNERYFIIACIVIETSRLLT